jgi:hypothetical protein
VSRRRPTASGEARTSFSRSQPAWARHLATGGSLASGASGIVDWNNTGHAQTRYYTDFSVSVPSPADAVIYAGQSLELRSNQVRREDPSGSVWGQLGLAEGQYLTVPPSGQEGRSTEFIVKLSRGIPTSMADSGIDHLSAQLFVTPRYLNIPES